MNKNYKEEIKEIIDKLKINTNIHKYTKKALAHIQINKDGDIIKRESLKLHMDRTIDSFYEILDLYDFNLINNILNKGLSFSKKEEKIAFLEIYLTAIYLHDMGKTNPNFQKEKMKNFDFQDEDSIDPIFFKNIDNSNHSEYNKLSTFLKKEKYNCFDKKTLTSIIKFFEFGIITKHHGSLILENTGSEKLSRRTIDIMKTIIKDYIFVTEILFDLLITADIIATKFFYEENISLKEFVRKNFNLLNSNTAKNLETKLSYNKDIISNKNEVIFNENFSINELKMYTGKKVVDSLKKKKEQGTFFLKLATGIGKTNLSFLFFNFFKEEAKRLIFINPLNSLNQQVKTAMLNTFDIEEESIHILNMETKYDYYNEEENIKNEFSFKTLNFPVVITSHVNFFNKIFGKSKTDIMSLTNINKSIIIIDEIQLYNDQYLSVIYKYIELFEKYLDTKILVISATLPYPISFENFLNKRKLISNKEEDRINKAKALKRFNFNFDIFYQEEKIKEVIEEEIKNGSFKFLLTHNNIKKLNEVYFSLKEFLESNDFEIVFYQNTIIPLELNSVLNKIRNSEKNIICFATAKIETGIDISFHASFRFATQADDLYQNAGRVNRYGELKKPGNIYVIQDTFSSFLMGKEKQIKRLISMNNANEKQVIERWIKDLDNYFYKEIYSREEDSVMEQKLNQLLYGNFKEVNKFKLIEKSENTLFFVNIKVEEIENIEEKNKLIDLNINETKELFELAKNNIDNIKEYQKIIKLINLFSFNAYVYRDFKETLLPTINKVNLSKPTYNFKLKKFIESNLYLEYFLIELNKKNEYFPYYSLKEGLNQFKDEEEVFDLFGVLF